MKKAPPPLRYPLIRGLSGSRTGMDVSETKEGCQSSWIPVKGLASSTPTALH